MSSNQNKNKEHINENDVSNVMNDVKETLAETSSSTTSITGNIFLQRADHSLGNFLQFNKEILRKTLNNKPIPLETIGMFVRLLSVAEYTGDNAWNYSNEGMAKSSGCSSEKISRCMNELKQLGYTKRIDYNRTSDGRFGKNLYIVYETTNSELWDKNNLIENQLKPNTINSDTVIPNSDNSEQYNTLDIKENTYIRIDSLNTNNERLCDNNFISSKEGYITKNMLSMDTEFFSNKCSIYNSTDKHLNNNETLTKADIQSSSNSLDSTSENNTKQKKYETQQIQKITTLKKETKSRKILKKIIDIIQQEVFDSELKALLIEFYTVVIDTRKRMHESTFRNMMEDLEELSSGNLDLKKKIVKTSLRKGWLAFYPFDAKPKGISATKPIPRKREYTAEERAKMSRLARDENGEILKF